MRARVCPRANTATVIKCDAIMIVKDTVIDSDQRIATMEAILSRDQRTTSHRVLDRGAQQGGASSLTASSLTFANAMSSTFSSRSSSASLSSSSSSSSSLSLSSSSKTNACETSSASRANDRTARNRQYADIRAASRTEMNDPVQRHFRCDSCLVRNSYGERWIRSRRNTSVSITTWLRLGSLLVTLLVVSVHGAPTMTRESKRLSTPPKWVNPCGNASEDSDVEVDAAQIGDDQLLYSVVVQAKTALTCAQNFRDEYIKRTFNVDFTDLHSQWKGNHYDWLPSTANIPKELGDLLHQDFLDKLEIDAALLDAYEYMQKYAVALEQIVWDQEDYHLEFYEQFKSTEECLHQLLCELQTASYERAANLRPDVTRSAMPPAYRVMPDETYRNLRDWLIYRDYMNALEYVVQVFEHLRSGLKS